MKQRDYETAFAQYKVACDLVPESDVTHELRRQALDGLDESACRAGRAADFRRALRGCAEPLQGCA